MFTVLQKRQVRADFACPKCSTASEELLHVFLNCSVAQEVWTKLDLQWVLNDGNRDY